ncbi:MAG TPA: ATP-dependent DNA helicase, partial [Firmicutes bacterium]|nr:ATP-dependent DNA helicase [Bacillota bacterium]
MTSSSTPSSSLLSRWSKAKQPETLMEEVFGEQGLLARQMPGFEHRPEQITMAQAVARAVTKGRKVVIEAGTGTGKSLAYLIPLILWATDTGNRVIISTGTKTLQHQLLEKDLPLIKKTLGLKFNAALCLGAENYLCQRRYKAWLASRESFQGGKIARNRIVQWAKHTRTGIKAEIDVHPETWRQICRNTDLCPLHLCNKEPSCPYNRARQQWERAHLLVANHYLFFANIVARGSVLPDYGAVVFDEAHQLEDVATEYLGLEVSNFALERYLNTLHHPKTGRGLCTLFSYIEPELREELRQRTTEMRRRAAALFDAILEKYPGSSERVRMRQPVQGDPLTVEGLKQLVGTLKQVRKAITQPDDQIEVDAALSGAQDLLFRLETILLQKRAEAVYWLEVDRSAGRLNPEAVLLEGVAERRNPRVSLHMAPLSVAEALDRSVYQQTGPVILVSATLSVAGQLDYTCERLGLEQAEKVLLPHSFDYQRRVMLWVDPSAPDPAQGRQHQAYLIEQLDRLLRIVPGGTFVLFTSYRMLDSVFFELKKKWETDGAPEGKDMLLLRHGQAPREELLDEFR